MEKFEINESEILWRRVPLAPSHISEGRITSAVFKTKKDEDGLSININSLLSDLTSIFNRSIQTLCSFPAEIPIKEGYECKHDEMPDNYSHGLVLGDTTPIAKKLAKGCKPLDNKVILEFTTRS